MKKQKAFTLIEVVMTIVIIVVLSSISVPIYKKHTMEAKKAEGYVLLSALRDAQMRYYMEHRKFLDYRCASGGTWTANEEVLGIDARGNKFYTKFLVVGANSYGSLLTKFRIEVLAKNAPNMYLYYDITSGATFK